MTALLLTSMKVYAILKYAEDHEIVVDKIFSSRKKARKYIFEKHFTDCNPKDAKVINSVDAWIDIVELE